MLPTIEQCHEFMAAINAGRQAFGLEPIDKLDFDACEPLNGRRCVSAHHLINLVTDEGSTGFSTFNMDDEDQARTLANALGTETDYFDEVLIPRSIKHVTDPFDYREYGLRERLVEAGLVD